MISSPCGYKCRSEAFNTVLSWEWWSGLVGVTIPAKGIKSQKRSDTVSAGFASTCRCGDNFLIRGLISAAAEANAVEIQHKCLPPFFFVIPTR
jgi:hypothetical protein